MDKLIRMVESFHQAVKILHNERLEQQSIYMILVYLDQLGWLISSSDFSNGEDFRRWLDTYCDLTEAKCTSKELWNARCSHLHMGTSEGQRFKDGDFRLAFYRNVKLSDEQIAAEEKNYPKPTKMVDTSILLKCIDEGVANFSDALESNPELKESVLDKCAKMNNLYQ